MLEMAALVVLRFSVKTPHRAAPLWTLRVRASRFELRLSHASTLPPDDQTPLLIISIPFERYHKYY